MEEKLELTYDEVYDDEVMKKALLKMLHSFNESFINYNKEIIVHRASNTYTILSNCETVQDLQCKVLEWFSYGAYKGQPYNQGWRNVKFNKFMLNGINCFLDTNFSEADIEKIYIKLGNCANHELTVKFIESGYDLSLLEESEGEDE